ncbi:Transglutaminase-like cysteine peptidase,BTLCP [Mesorhizobium metallidurans STM 2683]|uniref:Transglutaminase-like cysteine peptidase,BTLCP n=1 Tax=Mesorhizobium metallidurans STM 2683 TaxID=1297569 RepID=M5ETU1_9HYPH|nr:transglutaminase-like cysteine peptidase [Mesorhizobium metallidurans]CCV08384.1 Transglutaminase-like cysteine peptidase,BTLCP [Mesorhizobium metallidurans STM 2683]
MKSFVVGAVALVLSYASANANALHLNPAQLGATSNMQTFGPTSIPIGYYEFCKRYPDRCQSRTEAVSLDLTRARWNQMVEINNRVNVSVQPLTDKELFGVEERWDYPDTAGDCEDYALMKRKILNEAGFPLGSLLMTVGRDAKGGGHAVLTVVTDRGDFVLDNVEQKILLWREAEIYFLKRQAQTDPNTWISLVRG